MLSKLHFDFRNAKPAAFGVSYYKLDDEQADVLQTEQNCSEKSRQVDPNQAALLNSTSDTDVASADKICKTGSAALCDQDYTQSADELLPDCIEPDSNIASPSIPPSSLFMSNSVRQTNKLADFSCCKKQGAKRELTSSDIAKKETAVSLHSSSCSIMESPARDKLSVHSGSSSIVLFDDDFDSVPLSWRQRSLRSAGHIKKSLNSKNTQLSHTMIATSVTDEIKYKPNKAKIQRTPQRRRKIKSNSEDDAWSTHKKLLIMPVDRKLGRGRQRNTRIKRDIFAQMPKHKAHNVKEMELPDLNLTVDADDANMPDALRMNKWEHDADSCTVSSNTSGKWCWCVDITGSDLTTDLDEDYKQTTASNSQQKSVICDTTSQQIVPHNVTDGEYNRTDFSTSQETPPPSVASDTLSSCDGELDQATQEEQTHDCHWVHMDTVLAHYIDGRRFDRPVNGISIRVSATLLDETLDQIGNERLCLSQLTKRDVKELQDQVRLEEIYHRRARKTTMSLNNSRSERVERGTSWRHVTGIGTKSTDESAVESKRTVDEVTAMESAVDDTLNHQDAPAAAAAAELHRAADESDNETVPYASDDDKVTKLMEGTWTSELLTGNVTDTSQGTDHSHFDKQQESVSSGIVVRIKKSVSADKSQSEIPDQLGEATPVSLSSHEPKSSPSISDIKLMPDSMVLDKCVKVSLPVKSLQKFYEQNCHADKQPAAVNTEHIAKANMIHTVTRNTTDSELAAAVALAALSLPTTDKLLPRPMCESEARIEQTPGHYFQSVNNQKSTHTDTNIAQNITRDGRHLKDARKRDHHVSTDKQHDVRPHSKHTMSAHGDQKSRSHTSRSADATGRHKQVVVSKEKSSATCSSKSAISIESSSSCVATGSVSQKKTGLTDTSSQISSRNGRYTTRDKSRHRRHRSRSRCSGEKKMVDHHRQQNPAATTNNSASYDSVSSGQTVAVSDRRVINSTVGVLDVTANDIAMTVSSASSASTDLLCATSSNHSSQSSTLSSSALNSVMCANDIVEHSHRRISRGEAELNSQETKATSTLSLPKETRWTEAVSDTEVRQVSDLNSNTVLRKIHTLSSATNKQHDGSGALNIRSGKIPDNKVVLDSCSRLNEAETTKSSESAVVFSSDTPMSPTSPHRATEDIQSPSPIPADLNKDDRSEEIRSPSPCDIESPAAAFRIVETSWDVRLTSPCEIQSPDVSDDEAGSIDEFGRLCNVCFQHGPVTIPLTTEEASERNA